MENDLQPTPDRSQAVSRTTKILLLAGFFVVCLVIVSFGVLYVSRLPKAALAKATEKREQTIDLAVVLSTVKRLNRLETASMQVTQLSKTEQSYGVIPKSIAGDELTFYAVGEVIAGIDLARLTPADVRVEGDVLILRIPPPQILVTRLDNQKSRVIDRDTGALSKHDDQLESRVRARAEAAVRNAAVRNGILDTAAKNGELQMAELLHKFGYQKVRVEQQPAITPAEPHL